MNRKVRSLVTEYEIQQFSVYEVVDLARCGIEGYITVLDDDGEHWPLTVHEYIFLEDE